MTAQPDYQLPDFELRDLVLKTLREHKGPLKSPDVKVACSCGWHVTLDDQGCRTNRYRFDRHVSYEIEYAVTALLIEDEQEVAA